MAMRDIVIRDKSLRRHFSVILQDWLDTIERYSRANKGKDALYWYNERATLSTFTGSIWKSGFTALEEYTAAKRPEDGETKSGRVDLWFQCGRTHYVVEAKQVWPKLYADAEGSSSKRIVKSLKRARQQVVSYDESPDVKLGLTFVTPRIAGIRDAKSSKLIQTFVDSLYEIEFDILAYTFPRIATNTRTDFHSYPGIALIAKRPRRSA